MLNIIERFTRPSPPSRATTEEAEILSTLRIADPAVLRAALHGLNQQIEAADAEWERLDRRADPSAYLQREPVATRLRELRAQAAMLPDRIGDAERRRDAFLQLAARFEDARDDVHARLCGLLEHPPQDDRERDLQLRALDLATKLHVRLAARLQAVSTDRRFREPPDALRVLRAALEVRIRELDRLRLPGMKRQPLSWPPGILELLETLEQKGDHV